MTRCAGAATGADVPRTWLLEPSACTAKYGAALRIAMRVTVPVTRPPPIPAIEVTSSPPSTRQLVTPDAPTQLAEKLVIPLVVGETPSAGGVLGRAAGTVAPVGVLLLLLAVAPSSESPSMLIVTPPYVSSWPPLYWWTR